jgi:hypothetical protein
MIATLKKLKFDIDTAGLDGHNRAQQIKPTTHEQQGDFHAEIVAS